MMGSGGVRWLIALIAGPTIWAAAFTAVYSLHGLGCSLGWTGIALGPLTLHRTLMLAAWVAGLLAGGALLIVTPATAENRLPRLGMWIGLVATFFTLMPLLVASSCS